MDTVRFVYLFHLPLFFFVTGYLYNEEKYGDNFYLFVANKIKSSWIKYVAIYWIAILLHNVFYKWNMLSIGAKPYSLKDTAIKMADAMLGIGYEPFVVTLWFVPVSVASACLLGAIVTLSRKAKRNGIKYGFQAIAIAALSTIGYYLEKKDVGLAAYLEVSLLVMLFLWGGYLLRKTKIEWEKYLYLPAAMIGFIVLVFASRAFWLDMVLHLVYPQMYIIAFIGIYVCLCFAKLIQKNQILRKVFSRWGKDSFWIMFLHITIWRLFDWIYTIVVYKGDFHYYSGPLPVAFPNLWPIYLVLGLGIPLGVSLVLVNFKRK